MADARLLHKKGSHGQRVIALDHLEFRVWVQYVLSADDFGVMRESTSVLRADNPRLEREPIKRLEKAMARVVESGLINTFTHQDNTYWWQTDWQDFQGIRYPRESVNPQPSPEVLKSATEKTRKLFAMRAEPLRKDFGNASEASPHPAGAGGRETLTLTLTPTLARSGSSEESARETKPLVDGAAIRAHGSHGWCSLPREGLCVPAFLHREFLGKSGRTDAELRGWYRGVVDRFEGVGVGEDALVFWRNEFASWVGVVTAAPVVANTRERRILAASARTADAIARGEL